MKMTMAVATAALLLVVACARQPEVEAPAVEVVEAAGSGWTIVAVEEFTEAQTAQQQRGIDAVQAMAGSLMGELTAALDEGGPDGAIEVCSMRAPEIAGVISNQYGVILGRTSHRLRNQSNLPPEWAVDLVQNQAADTDLVGRTRRAGRRFAADSYPGRVRDVPWTTRGDLGRGDRQTR